MRIAIVGAGKGGTALIQALHGLEGFSVAVVVDRSTQSQGILLAKSLGIPCETEMDRIQAHRVDAVIEATGVPQVQALLTEQFGDRYQIIHSSVAEVMMSIVGQHASLHERLNSQLEAIGQASEVFQSQFSSLAGTVGTLSGVGTQLGDSVQKSTTYIRKSDELSKAVNQIANQIKILGINANIEAARAGEAGKGFAVVASEVQKLSDTSTQFANEISAMLNALSLEIGEIQAQVKTLNAVSGEQTATAEAVQEELVRLTQVVGH